MGKKRFVACATASLFVVSVLLYGSASFASTHSDRLADPIKQGNVAINLVTVANDLIAPNWGTFASGDNGRLSVTDQNGTLWAIDLTTGDRTVFLDVSSRLVALGISGPGTFDERGLSPRLRHQRPALHLYLRTSERFGRFFHQARRGDDKPPG